MTPVTTEGKPVGNDPLADRRPLRWSRMSLTVTLILLAATLVVIAFANWQERRKRPLGKTPLVSYPALQMLGILFAVLLLAHLVSLLTGQPLRGRRMP